MRATVSDSVLYFSFVLYFMFEHFSFRHIVNDLWLLFVNYR
jgi:hypothetical protein